MALIITPKYQYFRRTSRKEAVQISLPEGRILGTLPVDNFKDKGSSDCRKPRVSKADSDLKVKKISRRPRVSTDSGTSINSRVSRDSLSRLPEDQHQNHPKGHLSKDSMVNAPTKVNPGSSRRFSLQQPTKTTVVDFKVPSRQMPIEWAPSLKKSSITEIYQDIPSAPKAGNSNSVGTLNAKRKCSAPAMRATMKREEWLRRCSQVTEQDQEQ